VEAYEGTLERITFYSAETTFMVGRLSVAEQEDLVFVGHFPPMQEGDSLRLKGEWKVHPRYGPQLQVKEWESVIPTSAEGLQRFLASGLIKGVGEHTARQLVKQFDTQVLEVIENSPQELTRISGIGPKKASMIHRSYLQHKNIKEVMLFLQHYGISPALAVRLFKHYGEQTITLLKENPYRLAEEMFGVGFLTADRIARQLGLPFNSPQRIRAAIQFMLNQAAAEGHVFLPAAEVREKVLEMLYHQENKEGAARQEAPEQGAPASGQQGSADAGTEKTGHSLPSPPDHTAGESLKQGVLHQARTGQEITADLVESQLEILEKEGRVIRRTDAEGRQLVYAAPFFLAEKGAAERLVTLLEKQLSLFSPEDEGVVEDLLQDEQIELAPEQVQAVYKACSNGVMVVTGGPGTGKTTTIKTLLKLFQRHQLKVLLAAPTGRAAKRMTETTGLEAKTIHRLLEYSYVEGKGFRFQRNEENPIPARAIIVDEASMLDLHLFYNLLKAVPPGCRLILVGDVDQLPSVGAGNVLRDIIQSGVIPCVRLNTIFRQARESMIVVNAHRINQGEKPVLNKKERDFFFIKEEDPEQVASTIVDLCRHRLPRYGPYDPLEDIQVLTPMRKTPVGVERLNLLLQGELNPPSRSKAEIQSGSTVFRLGDKVMQIRNNYEKEVFNGDVGRIAAIDREEGELWVCFNEVSGIREVPYDLLDLDELVLSYAVSVHKSQGSEYPVVVMPVVTQHFILLQRNLLYTGITRAKNLVVLIGTFKAVAIAVNNNKVEKRYSYLDTLLQELSG